MSPVRTDRDAKLLSCGLVTDTRLQYKEKEPITRLAFRWDAGNESLDGYCRPKLRPVKPKQVLHDRWLSHHQCTPSLEFGDQRDDRASTIGYDQAFKNLTRNPHVCASHRVITECLPVLGVLRGLRGVQQSDGRNARHDMQVKLARFVEEVLWVGAARQGREKFTRRRHTEIPYDDRHLLRPRQRRYSRRAKRS